MSIACEETDVCDTNATENATENAVVAFHVIDGLPTEPDTSNSETGTKILNSFENFSGYTTLHGLRFIGDQNSVVPRRGLWLVLVLLCGTLFSLQVYDRVSFYMSSPINVNLKINYNQSIAFPAITICNQNRFRLSMAYNRSLLPLIMGLYGNDSNALDLLANSSSLDLPLSVLFEEMSHRKEDFIVRCRWGNEECSEKNFTTTLTRHGVCYTFNKASAPNNILQVKDAGMEHGLQLILNTEHYEGMAGPQNAYGIKMIATDQSDNPMVDEIGLAIPAGIHAFVAIDVQTFNNLPPPHGECMETPLKSQERYSPESCMMECKTDYVLQKCGCRNFYMPDLNGKTRICTVREYVNCLKEALRSFNNVSDTMCACPASCSYHMYESSVSYATSSNMKDDLKDKINEDVVKDRYYVTKELTSRLDNKTFQTVVEDLEKISNRLIDMYNRTWKFEQGVLDLFDKFNGWIEKRKRMFHLQYYVIEMDLMRDGDAMEEQVFGVACFGFYEFVSEIENKISYLKSVKDVNSSEARIMYRLAQKSLRSRINALQLAVVNFPQLANVYKKGESDWNEHIAILAEAYNISDFGNGYRPIVEDIISINESLVNYENYINSIFRNDSMDFEEEHSPHSRLSAEFIRSCKQCKDKKNIFYREIIERPLKMLKLKQEEFTTRSTDLISALRKTYKKVWRIHRHSAFRNWRYGLKIQSNKGSWKETESRFDVAKRLTKDYSPLFLNNLETGLVDYINDLAKLDSLWKKSFLKAFSLSAFTHIDKDIKALYQLRNLENMQQSVYSLYKKNLFSYERTRNYFHDIKKEMQEFKKTYMGRIKDVIREFAKYKEDCEMDEEFFRANFLQVDTYFKDTRSEQIDQQIAYDEIALLCDIGGSMGLFIGGSVITFFEIMDFIFVFIVQRLLRGPRA